MYHITKTSELRAQQDNTLLYALRRNQVSFDPFQPLVPRDSSILRETYRHRLQNH